MRPAGAYSCESEVAAATRWNRVELASSVSLVKLVSGSPITRLSDARSHITHLTTHLTPCVLSDSQDRSIIDLRIAICHMWYDRSIIDLRLAFGAQRVLADIFNASLCLERV